MPTARSLLDLVAGLGDGDVQQVKIKITPVLAAFRHTDRGRATPALGLSAEGVGFVLSEARPLENRAVDYSHDTQYYREVQLPPAALQRFIRAMAAEPRFTHSRLPERPMLSVLVLRAGRGFSEVFIDVGDADAFAKALTDAAIGTRALQLLLQWEMNL